MCGIFFCRIYSIENGKIIANLFAVDCDQGFWSIDLLIDMIDWLIDWLIYWLIDRLIDWLIDSMNEVLFLLFMFLFFSLQIHSWILSICKTRSSILFRTVSFIVCVHKERSEVAPRCLDGISVSYSLDYRDFWDSSNVVWRPLFKVI